jgi:hypothetical protein
MLAASLSMAFVAQTPFPCNRVQHETKRTAMSMADFRLDPKETAFVWYADTSVDAISDYLKDSFYLSFSGISFILPSILAHCLLCVFV